MRASILVGMTATLLLLMAAGVSAGPKKGDLLVTDFNRFALLIIDPVTGNRSVLSAADGALACFGSGNPLACCTGFLEGPGCDPAVGAGPAFRGPLGIALEVDGNILVVDRNATQIFRVDPATGNRTILSGNAVTFLCREAGKPWACCTGLQTGGGSPPCVVTGTGPLLIGPDYLAVETDGNVLLADSSRGILRLDPVTGDRTVISSSTVGAGLDFKRTHGIALEDAGTILVAEDEGSPELFLLDGDIRQVDPVSGDRTILSGHFSGSIVNGSGPNFKGPWDVAVESNGDLLVTDFDLDAVFRVSPVTGDRTILSGQDLTSACTSPSLPFLCCTGSGTGDGTPPCGAAGAGPPLNFDFAGPIAVELSGSIVVVTVQGTAPDTRGTVIRVDPMTGDRTVVSSPTVGSGPEVLFSAGVAVVTQDTPGTGIPALSGQGVALFLLLLAGGLGLVRLRNLTLAGIAVALILFAATITLASPKKGDLLISDSKLDTIFVVDPVTGNRTILSASDQAFTCLGPSDPYPCCTGFHQGSGCGPAVGNGPVLDGPRGITVDSDGNLLVASNFVVQIFRVDPATGDRTIISGRDMKSGCNGPGDPFACCTGNNTGNGTPPCTTTGSGPHMSSPEYLAVDAGGNILLVDSALGVLRVDPVSGDRTVVSGCTNSGCSSPVGSGLNFRRAIGIALADDGGILVTDTELFVELFLLDGAVIHADPSTGDRIYLSGHFGGSIVNGAGPNFKGPWGITVESTGDILVTDFDLDAVFRVDPTTGDRTIVSGKDMSSSCTSSFWPFVCCTGVGTGDGTPPCVGVGAGPPFTFNSAGVLALEEDGSIVVGQFDGPGFDVLGTVLRVDPLTGDRTVVSSPTVGTGPVLLAPAGITVATLDTPGAGVPALSARGAFVFVLFLIAFLYAAHRRSAARGQG